MYESLKAQGISAQVHYIPIHYHPYYQAMGFRKGNFPNAEAYYQGALSLPLYPDLTKEQQQQVIQAVQEELQ